jgi:hypothetical protein
MFLATAMIVAGTAARTTASASPSSASAHPGSAPVVWRSARNRPFNAIRPRIHYVLADISFRKLRWLSWGNRAAHGHGTFWWDCQIITGPHSCAPLKAPMSIWLTKVRRCPDGHRIFSHAVARPKNRPKLVFNYDCRGRSRGEGTMWQPEPRARAFDGCPFSF